ncbi:hypothetical protein OUZ56_024081 [Daphnia magna]|uniref:Uncharacterized protein n=1 Tax=Daphnia magna TaxID=35525 RepID=A0ABR0B033_9CRUS|nr:hypothetical protein OUZ56_024081 [Daphnia magna]
MAIAIANRNGNRFYGSIPEAVCSVAYGHYYYYIVVTDLRSVQTTSAQLYHYDRLLSASGINLTAYYLADGFWCSDDDQWTDSDVKYYSTQRRLHLGDCIQN